MVRTAFKFGLFIALCLLMTLYLAFTIGNIKLFTDDYELTASFDDVTGLLVNDNVKIAGVAVWKVTDIEVDDGRAVVTFTVDERYQLRADSTASVRWRNLIGQRYLYLQPGTDSATVIPDGGRIESTESTVDIGELFNRLGPIVRAIDPDQLNQFLDTVTQALDGNEDKVGQAIDDLAVLARALGERDQTIGRLIENLNTVTGTIANRDEQIRVMLDNLVLISQTFSANTDVLDQALVEVGDLSSNLNSLLQTNRAEIDNLIASLDLTTQTVISRIETIDRTLGNIDELASSIFRAGSIGEWLNQDILCLSLHPPPCSTPIPILPAASVPGASAGAHAPTPEAGVDAITQLVTGRTGDS